jgi:hypothetical protein
MLIVRQMFGLKTCMNLCWLPCTYPCSPFTLGPLEDQNQFWNWRGQCKECRRPRQGLKGLFCANFSSSRENYPPCQSVWCGECYRQGESDKFHINKGVDEDGNDMLDRESDANRYKTGIDGSHLMTPFQCDICIFRNLYKRDPRSVTADKENLVVIRRMNLDSIWSREPSTISKNAQSLARLIRTCEGSGFCPELPKLGPFQVKDKSGFCVAFSMLIHSLRAGRHTKLYIQFDTIRKQRSAFSNVYFASADSEQFGTILAMGDRSNGQITKCPTHSFWFS